MFDGNNCQKEAGGLQIIELRQPMLNPLTRFA